jgi:general secretion pathway protein M
VSGGAAAAAEARAAVRARWQALAPRERSALALAAAVVGLYATWALAVQPAWRTLRDAPAAQAALDRDLAAMQRLAAEAETLKGIAPLPAGQAGAALQSATSRLGSAGRLVIQGDRAVLTLTDADPDALRAWLAEVRSGARARPVEASLQPSAAGLGGTVVVTVGAAP